MPKFRNRSSDVVLDWLTGRVAAPDEVIDVPDDQADAYEGHALWEPVAEIGKPRTAVPAAPDVSGEAARSEEE